MNSLRSVDWITILLFLLLLAAGWLSVAGASYTYGETNFLDFSTRSGKQLVWMVCALIIGLVILLSPVSIYETYALPVYCFFLLLLAVTPFVATNVKGSYSWIPLGPVSLQPAEFAKCATALALSRLLSEYGFSLGRPKDALRAALICLLPIILIFLQRETGSALVYLAFLLVFYREGMSGSILFCAFAAVVYFVVGLRYSDSLLPGTLTPLGTALCILLIWLFQSLLARIYLRDRRTTLCIFLLPALVFAASYGVSRFCVPFDVSIAGIVALAASAAYLAFIYLLRRKPLSLLIAAFIVCSLLFHLSTASVMNNVLQPHQQTRIRVLLGLEQDLTGAGYNVHQAEIAIGSGGLWGKGFLNGTQTKLKYVPEQDTDFIFCTVGEEHGFVGAAAVLLLFLALCLRILHLAERQPFAFGRVYGYSVFAILLFHVFINIGMVMGLTPVIGIPLPFFSYGGSSLWGFSILLFIFLRIDAQSRSARN